MWSGGVSDTEYFNKYSVLEFQKKCIENDLVGGEMIPFLNVLDKGYWSTVASYRDGCQLTLQPNFAQSDRKFKAVEVISLAAVHTDHSGNERSVRLSKSSNRLKVGAEKI